MDSLNERKDSLYEKSFTHDSFDMRYHEDIYETYNYNYSGKIPVASLNTGRTGSVDWRKTLAGWLVQTEALPPLQ